LAGLGSKLAAWASPAFNAPPVSPASDHEPASQPRASALDVWLSALPYWYLTALLAALGFSFGFYFVQPRGGAVALERDWLDAFTWMDGRWYKQIAAEGYKYDPDKGTNIAFFPVYPLLGRALVSVTGLRAEAALLIVSNLSFLAALAMLARYVRERYPNSPTDLSDYTVLTAAIFPTGCFFRLAYSESTFLLLAVLAMYAMRRRWPLWAIALIVGLATATRPVGVALLAPFAIHLLRRGPHQREVSARQLPESPAPAGATHGPVEAQLSSLSGRERIRVAVNFAPGFPRLRFGLVCARLVLYLPLACWGFGAFTVYQYAAFGEPFATVKVQKHWGTPAPWREKVVALATLAPVRSVYDPRSSAFWALGDDHGIPWFSLQFANPLFFAAAVALIALGASLSLARRSDDRCRASWLSMEEVSLAILLLLIPYVTRAYEMRMGSMGRFTAVVFPVFLVIGQLLVRLPGPLRAALLAVFGFFLAAYTALYVARYGIF